MEQVQKSKERGIREREMRARVISLSFLLVPAAQAI